MKISELDFYSRLPKRVLREIDAIALSRSGKLSEIRLRCGKCSVTFGGERIFLSSVLTEREIGDYFSSLIEDSLYAYRDSLREGYISVRGGVRIGVVGSAGYDGDSLVGISKISSLCIRIPGIIFEPNEEIIESFNRASSGLLIYSPPGMGKTSALRSLAAELGSSRRGFNVAVIDERLEFSSLELRGLSIDVLSGYKKRDGLEIALRSLSPDVIIVDEIGGAEEADSMLSFLNSGVKIAASAHAASYEELIKRKSVEPFLSRGVFDVFLGIRREKNRFFYNSRCGYD